MDIAAFNPSIVPAGAKWAFTTRRVLRQHAVALKPDLSHVVSGDLVLGEIIEIGQHRKIQLAEGRASESYPGDIVVLTCGDRYAPDQFEGVAELDPAGSDLIAAGGLIGRMRAAHMKMAVPTRIKPLGLLADREGEAINIAHYAIPQTASRADVSVIVVVGASMNAGKTTAVAGLAHGLTRAGHRVAAVKATGTGAFGDYHAYVDAGVAVVADFTDAGMASTYRQPVERIEQGFVDLIGFVAGAGADVVVVEIADGVFQKETAELLRSATVREALDGVMFAAPDALGAVGGVAILRQLGLEPFAVSGMVSCSPLAVAEAHAVTQVPIVSRDDLRNPECVSGLVRSFIPEAASVDPVGTLRSAA